MMNFNTLNRIGTVCYALVIIYCLTVYSASLITLGGNFCLIIPNLFACKFLLINQQKEEVIIISLFVFLILPNASALIMYFINQARNPENDWEIYSFERTYFDGCIIWGIVSCVKGEIFGVLIILVILFLSATLSWRLKTFRLISKAMSINAADRYLNNLIVSPPYIDFSVRVYKTELIPKYEHVMNENEQYELRESPAEREFRVVENYQRTVPYKIRSWRDKTDRRTLRIPQDFPIVKVETKVSIVPKNDNARQHYKTKWSEFLRRNKRADNEGSFSASGCIAGTKPKISFIKHFKGVLEAGDFRTELEQFIVFLDPQKRPFFLRTYFYLIVALTPFSWAYSLWIDRIATVSRKTIVKEYS